MSKVAIMGVLLVVESAALALGSGLVGGPRTPLAMAAPIALHLGGTLLGGLLPSRTSDRWLAATFVALVPLMGCAGIMLLLATRRQGAFVPPPLPTVRPRAIDAGWARRLATEPALVHSLFSSDMEARAAALRAVKTGDERVVALLRWVLANAEVQSAVEVAMTIEDMRLRLESEVESRRRCYRAAPTHESARALVARLITVVEAGFVEQTQSAALLDEAATLVQGLSGTHLSGFHELEVQVQRARRAFRPRVANPPVRPRERRPHLGLPTEAY